MVMCKAIVSDVPASSASASLGGDGAPLGRDAQSCLGNQSDLVLQA